MGLLVGIGPVLEVTRPPEPAAVPYAAVVAAATADGVPAARPTDGVPETMLVTKETCGTVKVVLMVVVMVEDGMVAP